MEGIKDKVAIIGMGCTKFGELWDKSQEDLMVDAAYEAFEDAGIEPKDIQAAWLGTAVSGILGMRVARAIRPLEFKPITHVENLCCSGTEALRGACYAVAAGVYDIALAIGFEKLKNSGVPALIFGTEPDDRSKIDTVVPPPTGFAQLATRYFSTYGLSYEEGKRILAMIAVKNHHNGSLNPKAHLRREITVEQAMNAPMIAHPLGLFDCCGVSDGGAAAIITRADMAKNFRDDYVLVKALGLSVGGYRGTFCQDYDFVHVDENVRAAQMAYQEAGIKDPRKEVDVAIVHDCFTIHELLLYEDLGFSPRGRAKEDVEAGTFTLEGELPVNSDGGLKTFGHPLGASGLRMIYEVYKQMQGKAQLPQRQLKDVEIGLTHNLGGWPFSGVGAVTILGRP
jgi:acetyl-CoA C-acetyltransferase